MTRRTGAALTAALLAAAVFGSLSTSASGAGPVGFTVIATNAPTSCQLARIDLSSGALSPFGATDALHCPFDLALASDGVTLYGVIFTGTFPTGAPPNAGTATAHLMRYDTTTGAATDLGAIGNFTLNGPDEDQGALAFDTSGNLLIYLVPNLPIGAAPCDYRSECLYRVSLNNPAGATPLGHVPQMFEAYFGLAARCTGPILSIRVGTGAGSTSSSTTTGPSSTTTRPPTGSSAAGGWGAVHLQVPLSEVLTSVNPTDGSSSDVGSGLGTGNFALSLDYDTTGAVWGVGLVTAPRVFAIDPSTGVATPGAPVTNASAPTDVQALAIAPACPVQAIVVQPRFTG